MDELLIADDDTVDSFVGLDIVLMGETCTFSSSLTLRFDSRGATVVEGTVSLFFVSAAFFPKHDAHRPADDLCFDVPSDNVGNGPGLTKSTSGR